MAWFKVVIKVGTIRQLIKYNNNIARPKYAELVLMKKMASSTKCKEADFMCFNGVMNFCNPKVLNLKELL